MVSWITCSSPWESQSSRISRKPMSLTKLLSTRKNTTPTKLTARRSTITKRRLQRALKCFSWTQIFKWRRHLFNRPTWRAVWSLTWETSKNWGREPETMTWALMRWLTLSLLPWPTTPLGSKERNRTCSTKLRTHTLTSFSKMRSLSIRNRANLDPNQFPQTNLLPQPCQLRSLQNNYRS